MVVNNISIFTTLFVINQTYPILHVVLVVNESIVLSILSSFWNLEQSPAIRGWKSITLLLIFALLGWNYIVYLCTQRNWFYLLSFSPPFHCVVSTVSAWRHPPMAGRWVQSQCQKKDNPPSPILKKIPINILTAVKVGLNAWVAELKKHVVCLFVQQATTHPGFWDHTSYWLEIGNSLLIGEFYHIFLWASHQTLWLLVTEILSFVWEMCINWKGWISWKAAFIHLVFGDRPFLRMIFSI